MSESGKEKVENFLARIRYLLAQFFKATKETMYLSDRNWKWISAGSLAFILFFLLGFAIFFSGTLSLPWLILALLMIAGLPLLFGGLVKLGLYLASHIPKKAGWLTFAAVAVFFIYFKASFKGMLVQIFYLLLTFIFIFGSLSNLLGSNWKVLHRRKKLLTIFFLSVGVCNLFLVVYFLAYPGREMPRQRDFGLDATYLPSGPNLPDPSVNGGFSFTEFTYGSGKDRNRPEYADGADMISNSVDASAFVGDWDRFTGKLRSLYWGFGADSLPLNARGWLPEGDGPFPLILMVHGNHLDRDYSDTGYAYMGRHLASLGYLAVSVDENFLNGGLTNFGHALNEENDARGWLLLKHLEQLREWNRDTSSMLYGLADTKNVILIGHSRGGEAVSIAASFNPLSCYPDDGLELFDFNFGIKGIVAIAQVDGQYHPSNIQTPIENINYLSLQGSLDADLDSYLGLSQYNRVKFTDSLYHFKAGLYIENANHGQFNTSWGGNDIGYPNGLFLNRKIMLDKKEQEKIALLYISSFVKTSFREETGYLSIFRDYRAAREWLPDTRYINQFQDNRSDIISDYEEDIELKTASLPDVGIFYSELASIWEERVNLKKGNSGTKSLIIGWNNLEDSIPGEYGFRFADEFTLPSTSETRLQFDVAVMDQDPGERKRPEDESGNENMPENVSLNSIEYSNEEEDEVLDESMEDEEEKSPLSFIIRLVDAEGDTAEVSMMDHFPLNPPMQSEIYKMQIFYGKSDPEIIPQHVEIDLESFRESNPLLNTERLRCITFVFSDGDKGMIALDNVGFTKPADL